MRFTIFCLIYYCSFVSVPILAQNPRHTGNSPEISDTPQSKAHKSRLEEKVNRLKNPEQIALRQMNTRLEQLGRNIEEKEAEADRLAASNNKKESQTKFQEALKLVHTMEMLEQDIDRLNKGEEKGESFQCATVLEVSASCSSGLGGLKTKTFEKYYLYRKGSLVFSSEEEYLNLAGKEICAELREGASSSHEEWAKDYQNWKENAGCKDTPKRNAKFGTKADRAKQLLDDGVAYPIAVFIGSDTYYGISGYCSCRMKKQDTSKNSP